MSRIMVDELQHWGPTKLACFRGGSCHLTTDGDIDGLHRFARQLGLLRSWCHNGTHYDLSPRKRELALRNGAVFVPAQEQAQQRIASRRAAK